MRCKKKFTEVLMKGKRLLFTVLLLTAGNYIFGQFYTGDGGRGIVIAVPAPVMRNVTANDGWMPQLFQDLITGDLARFSAMTVIDRSNEQMVIAEQNLSASGNYSDNDYVRMGNLTNARYIVVGSIQNISGRYNVSFRINNTETNEIRATFNKAYSPSDIETGLAAKEAVRELLRGMGIRLTATGERTLLTVQAVEARATTQLARGMAAAKSDNIVQALAFLSDALESNTTRAEANRNIQSFFTAIPTGSIRERANFAIAQKEKWQKIFTDLDLYLYGNLPIFIYDFSAVEDRINISSNSVSLTIRPGI
jgi:TolB-like protein